MTFLEAAIEVLKREGKPLPVKRLAEMAVRLNLLSVVGRDPEGTMQLRIDDALGGGRSTDLFEVKQGVYGLRLYPERPYPQESAKPAPAPSSPASGGEATNGELRAGEAGEAGAPAGETAPKGRRRRGRRGRGKGQAAASAAAAEANAASVEGEEGGEREAEAGEATEPAAPVAPEAAAAPSAPEASASEPATEGDGAAEEERRGRRRSRRGGRGRRKGDRPAAEPNKAEQTADASEAAPVEASATAEEAGDADAGGRLAEPVAPPPESELSNEPIERTAGIEGEAEELGESELLGDEEELDLPGGPLLAPSLGVEEITRSEEEREVRAEIHGRRSEERGRRHRRERGRRGERERGGEQPRGERARTEGPRGEPGRAEAPGREQARAEEPRGEAAQGREGAPQAGGRPRGLVEAAIEILRNGEGGKPMHIRHLTDLALKRHLIDGKGGANEVSLKLRAALMREERERESGGLRPRVRALGGGLYALADRKLDPELLPLERELAERASRLREATRAAVRRRIQRLPAPAFEALGRALAEKLGLTAVELVRRGDGVAYFGGQKQLGVASARVLVAMRPGEAEISRRAVGELRAGLAAKGFDEGLLLAAGRASAEALTELKAGKGVVVHDGASLAQLLIHHGLGVRRAYLPVDYFDLEWFGELTEG